ncbi:ABC transporter substrate-binding protein [Paenibacillus pini]|uniref:ABC transporter substrate-binding protein n=1 Tax=Paenibacillus pini TaxID=669461 RepID=UPI000AE92B1D|nr:ABC transporter substrate-binding protein [Paenibacillus pini]
MKSRIWNKSACLLLVCTLTFIGLTGCTSSSKESSNAELTDLTVLLDWYPNAVHTFLYAAQAQGYFKEAGLNVKLQTPADTNDAIKLVATGKADLAFSYQMQVAVSRSEDIPIVSVAAIVRHPLNQLFALDSAEMNSPKDLIGKRIGYPSSPMDEAIVNTMVRAEGGDPAKLNYVDVGWDLIPSMTTKKVDAIIGGFVNHEKLLLEKEGEKLQTFDPAEYGVPDYYELVLAASEEGLRNKGDAIKKFLQAATKGQEYTAQHPDESLQVLLDKQDKEFPLDPEIERKSLEVLLPLMDAGAEPFGSQTEASWNSAIDWLTNHQLMKKEIKANEAFRNL